MWNTQTLRYGLLCATLVVATGCRARGLDVGRAAVAARGQIGARAVDLRLGSLACEHGGWINIYGSNGTVLVFAPRQWRPAVGEHTIVLPPDGHLPSLGEEDSGWINGAWGVSIPVLRGTAEIVELSRSEIRGRLSWTMGFPQDSARLDVVGSFRATRGCPAR